MKEELEVSSQVFLVGLSSKRSNHRVRHSPLIFSFSSKMSSAPVAPNTTDNSQQRPRQRNGPPPPRRQGRNPPPPTTTQVSQEKKKPVFVKVDQLKPGTSGHTLTVKVVDQNPVPQKPGAASSSHLRPVRIAECLVGDETASILATIKVSSSVINKASVFESLLVVKD